MKSHSVFSRHIYIVYYHSRVEQPGLRHSRLIRLAVSSTPNTPAPGGTAGPAATPAPRAQVTFTVRLPEPLLPGEVLMFSILDEVTGLAFNPVDYQMSMAGCDHLFITLAIPDRL